MRLFKTQRNPKLMEMAVRSLDNMACGGIYDQLGGGFHRYSVDDKWLVPHFEKMLYDNALLVPAYLEGFQLTRKQMYADVAKETLDYLLHDMRAPGGGFFSAEDAGDVGKEGEFYVWKESDLRTALGANFEKFAAVYPVTPEGNFEHATNVIHVRSRDDWNASRALKHERETLAGLRAQRARPHRDSKILTGWNGLTITALAKGHRVLGDTRYLEAAEKCAKFIHKELFNQGEGLLRRHCDGESRYLATASDYAYLIEGLLALYEAGFNTKWLLWARELQGRFDEAFWTPTGYTTAAKGETGLITRRVDRHDGATPSPNSVAMGNLLRLSQYFLEPALDDRASDLFAAHGEIPEKFPLGLPALLLGAILRFDGGPRLLVLSGVSAQQKEEWFKKFSEKFLPDVMVAMPGAGVPMLEGKNASGPTAYLCEDGTCHPPREAFELLKDLK